MIMVETACEITDQEPAITVTLPSLRLAMRAFRVCSGELKWDRLIVGTGSSHSCRLLSRQFGGMRVAVDVGRNGD